MTLEEVVLGVCGAIASAVFGAAGYAFAVSKSVRSNEDIMGIVLELRQSYNRLGDEVSGIEKDFRAETKDIRENLSTVKNDLSTLKGHIGVTESKVDLSLEGLRDVKDMLGNMMSVVVNLDRRERNENE